ncbi:MAG: hypothetical protein LAT77_03690 [Aliidiomarina sp.]|uniref:hypothetical protein n=1 Tax=Aliidiomarina sp. TaxID=1872439 RepID=UPI0025BDBF6E|nr:hypothetical protein [Aliidiomarina sp.]MCH8501000.1 hypothetical protein [Aliidiomarina sp.]
MPSLLILVVIVVAAIFIIRRLAANKSQQQANQSERKPSSSVSEQSSVSASSKSDSSSEPVSTKPTSTSDETPSKEKEVISKDVDPVIDSGDKSQPSPLGAEVPDEIKEPLLALDDEKDPLTRHRLYQQITETSYRNRADDGWRTICKTFSARHIDEFEQIKKPLAESNGGSLPQVLTFQNYATLLVEDGHYDKAINVCEQALGFGLDDKTKTGFAGRIERIQKQKAKDAS